MINKSELRVNLGERSYDIHISHGLLEQAGELIASVCKGRAAAIVTNPRVGSLYAERLVESLERNDIRSYVITIPSGERYKNLNTVRKVYDRLLDNQIDRTGIVIGLGGGVVGDLAGFVAATYLRGVDFVQVPTSLLAQVDASVGGKVGVDLPRGKNLVGAFYQPKIVIIDTATLSTLPARELRTGLAEVIKHGIILDSEYFSFIENALPAIKRLEPGALITTVADSCRIKANIVERDERESGLRAILNFGHTIGHALEAITGYKKYRHGEAVSIGMVAATIISEKMGFIDKQVVERIAAIIL
ncbi:MAG: 3-dehydroquinate synthase, partial [Armatimonadota bacterium]|nr:3-dehydroquinate synthase [Armatimonadota bacterium]